METLANNLIIDGSSVIGFKDEFVEEVIVPDGIVEIASGAFFQYYGLKKIKLPNSLKIIGNSAFAKCSSLLSICFNKSLETIGKNAFRECFSLETVDLESSSISIIPENCFREGNFSKFV